jgi:hypothetical protein
MLPILASGSSGRLARIVHVEAFLAFLSGIAAVSLKGYIDLYLEARREWRAALP